MRLPRTRPACARIRRCSEAVEGLTPSLRAMNCEQTPSRTRSPSTCGGECARGALSQPRISSRRSLASALTAAAVSILASLPLDELLCQGEICASGSGSAEACLMDNGGKIVSGFGDGVLFLVTVHLDGHPDDHLTSSP